MIQKISQYLYNIMVSGIIESGITEDGGLQCYQQIPFQKIILFIIILSLLHIFFMIKLKDHLKYQVKQLKPTTFEKIFVLLCFISYVWTFYYKLLTRKGLFMLNPCHIALLIQIYLLLNKNTQKNRIIYSAWTGWLFGPYMATFIPHLQGINNFQIFLYYYQHIALIPLGFLVLAKRYNFIRPTLKNQLPAFATIALYQFFVLTPFSRQFMVNLNFTLCHSPADPTFQTVKQYYFVTCAFGLNVSSYMARWVSYVFTKFVYYFLSFIGIQEAKIIESNQKSSSQSISTKDQ